MDNQILVATTLLWEAKSAIQAKKRAEAAAKLSQAYTIAKAVNHSHLITEIAEQFQRIGFVHLSRWNSNQQIRGHDS